MRSGANRPRGRDQRAEHRSRCLRPLARLRLLNRWNRPQPGKSSAPASRTLLPAGGCRRADAAIHSSRWLCSGLRVAGHRHTACGRRPNDRDSRAGGHTHSRATYGRLFFSTLVALGDLPHPGFNPRGGVGQRPPARPSRLRAPDPSVVESALPAGTTHDGRCSGLRTGALPRHVWP